MTAIVWQIRPLKFWLYWASSTPHTGHKALNSGDSWTSQLNREWLIIRSDSHPGAEAPKGASALRSPVSVRRGWDIEAVATGARREVEVFSRVDPVGSVRAVRSRLQNKVLVLQHDETSAEKKKPIKQRVCKVFKAILNNQQQTNRLIYKEQQEATAEELSSRTHF